MHRPTVGAFWLVWQFWVAIGAIALWIVWVVADATRWLRETYGDVDWDEVDLQRKATQERLRWKPPVAIEEVDRGNEKVDSGKDTG